MKVVEGYAHVLDWPGEVTVATAHAGEIRLSGAHVALCELGLILTPPGRPRQFIPFSEVASITEAVLDERPAGW